MGFSISAVMPVYNGGPYLKPAIESVLAQTRPPEEILAVDNGSTDGSLDVLRSFGGKVRLVQAKEKGLACARNEGMAQFKGDYAAFLDQDDLWRADKLEVFAAAAREHPAAGLFYSDAVAISVDGTPYRFMSGDPGPGGFFESLLRNNVIVSSTAMVRREAFARAGPLRTDFRHAAAVVDWEFFLRLSRTAPVCYVPRPLTWYRVHPGGAIKTSRFLVAEDALRVVALHGGSASPAVREEAEASARYQSGVRHLAALDRKEAREDFSKSLRGRYRGPGLAMYLAAWLPAFLLRPLLRLRRGLYKGFLPRGEERSKTVLFEPEHHHSKTVEVKHP